MATRLTSDDNTVGWITALPHEAVAAEALLDETHELPLRYKAGNVNDNNNYTLGSINGPLASIVWSSPTFLLVGMGLHLLPQLPHIWSPTSQISNSG